MASVTQRIKQIKQPYGGFIPPKSLTVVQLSGGSIDNLHYPENISPSTVGMVVDYLTRYMETKSVRSAFKISLIGMDYADGYFGFSIEPYKYLIKDIKGLDDKSIIAASKLTSFDGMYRAGVLPKPDEVNPDQTTIENIRTMVNRSLKFFERYGSKILDGFTFEGGYTDIVNTGDGDFTTQDTLWDFKVSKYAPTTAHTLQILMYWRMGLHSIHEEFQEIKYLGIYNPRLNRVYRISVSQIPNDVIDTVDKEVIGYTEDWSDYKAEQQRQKDIREKKWQEQRIAAEERRKQRDKEKAVKSLTIDMNDPVEELTPDITVPSYNDLIEYETNRISNKEIAEKHHVNTSTVKRWFKKLNAFRYYRNLGEKMIKDKETD